MPTSFRFHSAADTQIVTGDVKPFQVCLGGQDVLASSPGEVSDLIWGLHSPNSLPRVFHYRLIRVFTRYIAPIALHNAL